MCVFVVCLDFDGVALEAGEFGALDGRTSEDGCEVFLLHGEYGFCVELQYGRTRAEFLDFRDGGETVVRADILTDITAVDVSAETYGRRQALVVVRLSV